MQVLVSLAIDTLHDRGVSVPSIISSAPKAPDIFNNAKFKQFACAGLQSKKDGGPGNLIPTLNTIHICCQNEVWLAATFIIQDGSKLNIVQNFS